jgi:hypothetical protein
MQSSKAADRNRKQQTHGEALVAEGEEDGGFRAARLSSGYAVQT